MQIKLQHWLARKIVFLFIPLFLAAWPTVCPGQSRLQTEDLTVENIKPDSLTSSVSNPSGELDEDTTLYYDSRNRQNEEPGFRHVDQTVETLEVPIVGLQDSLINLTRSDSIFIPVELIEPGDQAVTAEIVFLAEQSTISTDEFDYSQTFNVSFSAADSRGAVKYVYIDAATFSSEISGRQILTFRLQNVSDGSVHPAREMIRIEVEPQAGPDVVINEINAVPVSDADGNGLTDESDDEFIELVNRGNEPADVSGWQFSDNRADIRHVFPEGTILPPGEALVLFANADIQPEASYGGAIVQNTNQSSTLGLDDTGDSPTLFDAEGNMVDSYIYDASDFEGQSLTRAPDVSGNFQKHNEIAGSAGISASPGTRADGSSFGQNQAIGIRGGEGWRAFAAPLQPASFADVMDGFITQGIPGSEESSSEASVYFWDETGGGQMINPASMSDQMMAGRGYLFYYFKNDRRKAVDSTLGIPRKIILDDGNELTSVSVPVSATDANDNGMIDGHEGFNLLGNPFNSYISVTALLDALEKVDQSINRNVLVWNHAEGDGNGAFRALSDGNFIAPSEAFFIRFMNEVSGTAVLNFNELQRARSPESYRGFEEDFGLEIRLEDPNYRDSYQLVFSADGTMGSDRMDAFKLNSLKPGSLNLYSRDGTERLTNNVLPQNLDGVIEIPVFFEGEPGEQQYEFTWEMTGQLPEDWNFLLRDEELNREIDLRNDSEYAFSYRIEGNPESNPDSELLIEESLQEEPESRFTLVVSPSAELSSAQDIESGSVKLNPNYPNPFNSATIIPFELTSETEVNLSIWNIVGQKVATLIDGAVRAAGEHTEPWNATDMPSGIYIAQLEVDGSVYIRKMTLIKN